MHQLRITSSGVLDLSVSFSRASLLLGNYIDINSLVHRRHLFFEAEGFHPHLQRLVDWDYALAITEVVTPTLIEAPLVFYDDLPRSNRITLSHSLNDAYRHIWSKHLLSGSARIKPHMSYAEIAALVRYAEGKSNAVEFGAGGSTGLLLRCVTGQLHSVENVCRMDGKSSVSTRRDQAVDLGRMGSSFC